MEDRRMEDRRMEDRRMEDRRMERFEREPEQSSHMPSQMNIDMDLMLRMERKLNMMIELANQIDRTQKYQLIIDTKKLRHNRSNYRFDLSREVNGITKLELSNYSLPDNYYNITSNNNIFEYYVKKNVEREGDEVEEGVEIKFEKKQYKFEYGMYKIENVLEELNSKTELLFSMGFDQKIEISSENNFKLEPGELLETNLGFMVDNENIGKRFVAKKLWDLRGPNYFLLYVDNIDPSNPLAILNLGGKSYGKIELNVPTTLNHLDIRIVDQNNKLVDFQGRYHSLTMILEAR